MQCSLYMHSIVQLKGKPIACSEILYESLKNNSIHVYILIYTYTYVNMYMIQIPVHFSTNPNMHSKVQLDYYPISCNVNVILLL